MLGLLYDVHGNRTALEAVLADAHRRGVRRWLIGGDVSAFGGAPTETLDLLRGLDPAAWIRGNHERWAAKPDAVPDAPLPRGAVAAVVEALGADAVAELHDLPLWAPLAHGGEAWHASPLSDVDAFAPEGTDPAEDARLLDGRTPDLLVVGHSHVAFARDVVRPDGGTTRVVNPGSVGLPFDGDPRASYAILHDEDAGAVPTVEHVRVEYDVEAAVAAVEAEHAGRDWASVVVAGLRTGSIGAPAAAEDEPGDAAAPDAGAPVAPAPAADGPADPGPEAAAPDPAGTVPAPEEAADLAAAPIGEPEAAEDEDDGPLPVMRAGGFEVVDPEGRARARLGVEPGGGVSLDLADEDGRVRATVVVEPDGSAALKLADVAGTYRAALGAWLDGAASLDFYDRDRNQRVSLGEQPGAAGGLALWDGAGHLRALLGEGPAGDRDASLEFWDADGAYRVGLGVWPDGGTGTEMLDDAGVLRVRLGQRTEERRPATLELYGGDGAFRVAAGEYPDGAGRVNLWDGEGRTLPAGATGPPTDAPHDPDEHAPVFPPEDDDAPGGR